MCEGEAVARNLKHLSENLVRAYLKFNFNFGEDIFKHQVIHFGEEIFRTNINFDEDIFKNQNMFRKGLHI